MANETQIVLKVDEKNINAFGILTAANEILQKTKESDMHPMLRYAYVKNLKKSVAQALLEILPQDQVEQLIASDTKVIDAIKKGQNIYLGTNIFRVSHYRRYGFMGKGIPDEHRILEKRLINTLQEAKDLVIALKPHRKRAISNHTAEILIDKPTIQYLGDAVDLKAKSGKVEYDPNAGFDNNFNVE